MSNFKPGDRGMMVSHEHEPFPEAQIPIGSVGVVLSIPANHETNLFMGGMCTVRFETATTRPWVKNLRPAKEHYIQLFKQHL